MTRHVRVFTGIVLGGTSGLGISWLVEWVLGWEFPNGNEMFVYQVLMGAAIGTSVALWGWRRTAIMLDDVDDMQDPHWRPREFYSTDAPAADQAHHCASDAKRLTDNGRAADANTGET